MQESKRLSLNGLTGAHTLFLIISVAMIGVSVYLTNHFYQTHFPTGFDADNSLCEINSFWGCAKASTSAFGSIFHVPTSFFGVIVGLIGVLGAIFPSEQSEKFAKFVYGLNAVGCVILLAYSLIALKGLCPFCTIYYVLSFIAVFIYFKNSSLQPFPEAKPLIIYFIVTLIPSILMYNYYVDKMSTQDNLSGQYIAQYDALATPGDPAVESPYRIYSSTEKFADAPLRISVFSDFQCPFCKVVSDQMGALIKDFKGKINIQYMFYPLDNACNPNIKSSFHKFACKAAYLAACDKENFHKNHDLIFARQEELSFENLSKWEKELGLSGCFDNKQIQDDIRQTIAAGDQYGLQSTPTIIINGKKIEGTIPTVHIKAILNGILKKGK